MAEASSSDAELFTLEVVADADAPATARLFVGAVLRAVGRNEERINDLKLVVSEAMTAIAAPGSGALATLRIDTVAGMLEIEPIDSTTLPPGSIGLDVIAALFTDARIDNEARRLVVPFAASVAAP